MLARYVVSVNSTDINGGKVSHSTHVDTEVMRAKVSKSKLDRWIKLHGDADTLYLWNIDTGKPSRNTFK